MQTVTKATTIRVPARVLFYMGSTGWGQGVEPVPDYDPRTRLMDLMRHAPRNADGSLSVRDPGAPMLARLWFEAEHLADALRYGDSDPDTLADYNAGLAMQRRVAATLGQELGYDESRTLMYGEDPACVADPSHQHHSHDDAPHWDVPH